ncbi:BTAD domain-containing putative transcriptional regulator [Kribbella sp. HUAS MG21]|uniref:BTAD domain-containing putative transcriptional regulator n=1 Tax=Kribbella sp. HUAS MG21 TaxID=3160966 RepID=A0AAU7T6N9_9ACTN
MRFEVLGTVRVVVDGRVVEPISAFRRRLLAILLVRANRPVAVDVLVDALWDDDAPQRPANSLQVHVHRLRAALDRAGRLRAVPGGYQLDVAPDELDATVFGDLQAGARNAAAGGDLDAAVAGFRRALELWRGAPYDGFEDTALVAADARRLSEARMIAYEELYDAELRAGRAPEIVPELSELSARYPLRERLAGLLMLAQYRSGRRSRAEQTYRATHQRLLRELRTEPGRALRELYDAIRAEDPALDLAPAPRSAPAHSRAPRPAQLPPAPGGFHGREAELGDLATCMDGLVVVTGMAGVGKTGLAVQHAHQVADRYGDGQLYLDLRGHSSGPAVEPREALGHLLRGLGTDVVPDSLADATAELRTRIAGRKMLVLLDNAATTDQVRPLLPATSSCLTLVTSRNSLSGLIAREGARRIRLGTLDTDAAVALLAELLADGRVAAEPQQAAELVEACGRLPLAVRIAAAQLADEPHRSLADYLAVLRERGLSVLALDDDEESAVAAAFDLSYHHLPPDVRRLFRLAGLVPGLDFTADALAALGAVPVADARSAVRTLAGAHLLEEHAAGRYRFHDLVRDYARHQADASESAADRAAALDRLCAWYYLGKEEAAGFLISLRLQAPLPPLPEVPKVRLGDGAAAVEWLKAEFHNIVAAVRACADDGPAHWCWHLTVGVIADMNRHGYTSDLLAAFDLVLEVARSAGDQDAIALVLGEVSLLWSVSGRSMPGELIADMIAAGERSGDPVVLGNALYSAGVVRSRNNELEAAAEYLTRARDLQEQAGDTVGLTLTFLHLGNIALGRGDLHGALRAYERMLEIAGDRTPSLAVAGLLNLCHTRITIGQVAGLEELFAQGKRLVEQLQDEGRRSVLEYIQGSWYRDSGRVDEGIELITAAIRRAEELDHLRVRIHSLNELGFCHLQRRDTKAARDAFEQVLAATDSDLLREYRAHAVRGLALVELSESSLQLAESRAREAIALAAGSYRLHEGDAYVDLARIQLALNRPDAAIDAGHRALAIHQETSSLLGTARAHRVLGEATADPTHLAQALHHFETYNSPEAAEVRRLLQA